MPRVLTPGELRRIHEGMCAGTSLSHFVQTYHMRQPELKKQLTEWREVNGLSAPPNREAFNKAAERVAPAFARSWKASRDYALKKFLSKQDKV